MASARHAACDLGCQAESRRWADVAGTLLLTLIGSPARSTSERSGKQRAAASRPEGIATEAEKPVKRRVAVIIGNDPVGAADGILHTVHRNIGAAHLAPLTW
jgi:hypothetical protein